MMIEDIETEETEALVIVDAEAGEGVEAEETVALMDQERCIKQLAQSVSRNVKFRLNQMVKNRSIVEIVSINEDN
jgi:hypothetical protein